MTPLAAAFLSATLICAGLAMLFAPILLVLVRFVVGVMFLGAAIALAIITLSLVALDHVHMDAPTLLTPTAAVLSGGCILALGVLALSKARRAIARRRDAAVPRLARSVTPQSFVKMVRIASSPDGGRTPVRDTSVTRDAVAGDAIAALRGLGFSSKDAQAAVALASASLGPHVGLSALIKLALKSTRRAAA
jgi:hypothetical protein